MICSSAGRNRSFCRSSRGFDIARLRAITTRSENHDRPKPESQIARKPDPKITAFLQNPLLHPHRSLRAPFNRLAVLHGQLSNAILSRALERISQLSMLMAAENQTGLITS